MTRAFSTPKAAALALLRHDSPQLNRRSGSFCGQVAFGPDEPLSPKQLRWLADLLAAHGLPSIVGDDA